MLSDLYQADVIILSWDRVEDTAAAIDSALAQEGVRKRIFVVDQGSQPENVARLKAHIAAHPEVRVRFLERNSGVPGGRNIASRMGSAPYIVALDSDAVFARRDTLARAVRRLDAEPELCAIGFRILNFFTGLEDETSWDYPSDRRERPDCEFGASRFVGAGHAIRRSAFEAVGGYDDTLFFCGEEMDLCYRMLDLGFRIKYAPEVVVRHKISPEQRVAWNGRRYYFVTRNNLYTQFKLGRPLHRIALSAAAFTVRGVYNGVLAQSLRAVGAAVPMCWRALGRRHALSDATLRYIAECERRPAQTMKTRFDRMFSRLPGKAA